MSSNQEYEKFKGPSRQRAPVNEEDTAQPTTKEIPGIVLRVHAAVVHGRELSPPELAWQGKVKLSKATTVRMADGRFVKIPANTPYQCGIVILQDLVRKATQQGSDEMRYNFAAQDGGKPHEKDPLKFDIIEDGLDPNFSGAHAKNVVGVTVPKL